MPVLEPVSEFAQSISTLFAIVAARTLLGAQAPWSPNFGAQPLQANIVGVSSGPIWEGSQLYLRQTGVFLASCQRPGQTVPGNTAER